MQSDHTEGRLIDFGAPLTLNDIFGVIPGICLLLGFTFASVLLQLQSSIEYEVQDQKAVYDERVIQIPDPHFIDEKPQSSKPYSVLIPRFGEDGRPLLQTIHRTVRGRGKPILSETHSIILKPIIGTPEVIREEMLELPQSADPDTQLPPDVLFKFKKVYYQPNVSWLSTNAFETTQDVHFESSLNRENWALAGALVGSILSLGYVGWKLTVSYLARRRERINSDPKDIV
jgi:hypothetical protein